VQSALEYEERRQRDLLLDGEKVVQETLLWNPDTNRTESMRGKEDAHDYRYFPCPDLVPIEIDEAWIEEMRQTLPELPNQRKERFIGDYGLPEYDAVILTGSRELADYFESAVTVFTNAKKVSNWIMTELLRELKGEEIAACRVRPEQLGGLLGMVEEGTISGKIAKTVFVEMMETGKDPRTVVTEKNLVQVSDENELLAIMEEIVAANPDQAQQFREGKTKVMGFFVGQLMKKTKGKANPQMANELFQKLLTG
jgi:aspartyl-tRNA(Asn)/glutamyl-tRNA(Gln) amidotransferase subunit B